MILNQEKLQVAIEAYKKYFPTKINGELFKWRAVKCFQDNWDIDAENFAEMFWNATSKCGKLLTSISKYARAMMKEFILKEPETVRGMFRDLFAEVGTPDQRVSAFYSVCDSLIEEYFPGKMHYQDYNTITTYLWLRYPEKYYIYKYSEIRKTAQLLEAPFVVKKGEDPERLKNCFGLFDAISEAAGKDKDIRKMLNDVLTEDCDTDEALHTVAIDIDFFISRYYVETLGQQPVAPGNVKYWIYAPGEGARMWNDCLLKEIMCIGWDELDDLTQFETMEDIRKQLIQLNGANTTQMNNCLANWEFANEIQVGDVVFAKKGRSKIIGRGTVESDYQFDATRDEFKSVRKVKWTEIGEWTTEDYLVTKTLTEITQYKDYIARLNALVTGKVLPPENCGYWWLCANPKMWSIAQWPVGEEVSYTLYNANGHKRRVFQNFLDAKAGDKIICYEANPTKQISGLAIISHEQDGERVYFEKMETLASPIDYATIKEHPDLAGMEFLVNPNGSFFKLTKAEYETIMDLIRESNGSPDKKTVYPKYGKEDFLDDVYMSEASFDRLKNLLLKKKNIILQGAPGVGKTFSAERLAYAIMGEKDESRKCVIQFHQNYSYEDFIMGYKPKGDSFELVPGIFYKFCIAASNDQSREYFFIIDEINRGNLSKIFGELLMLIEKDYRNKPLTLAYKEEKFYVPSNVHIIGMMNTADRSLALIDYALRRRFSFFEMKPGFDSDGFRKYQKALNNARFDKLIEAVKKINSEVISKDDSLGEGFEIGHSYFCGQTAITDEWLHQVIDFDLIPMLQEYWFDNKNKVEDCKKELNKIFND